MDVGFGVAKTSLLVPPLLAIAYSLLGYILPQLFGPVGTESLEHLPLLRAEPGRRAGLAVLSTCLIIKSSELLIRSTSGPWALPVLVTMALLQWAALDGRPASLALGVLAGILGPVAEIPLMYLGAWHYTAPDYWPLAFLGFGPGTTWAGLSMTTGPCYFAVTTDAIALGQLFSGKQVLPRSQKGSSAGCRSA